jgi:hypothetical protein
MARPLSASVELIDSDLKPLQLLKREQNVLDESIDDIYCLNNCEQVYVPIGINLISEADKQKFLVWYENRKK